MSALAGISACLGRRAYIQDGHKPQFANIYVGLVGPAGSKKSTAIDIVRQLLEETNIRFAPDDTGGQRQGLIAALDDKKSAKDLEADEALRGLDVETMNSIEGILGQIKIKIPDQRDKQVLAVWASEMHSFMGTGSSDMMTFLIRMFDGDQYEYLTKTSSTLLKNPLITILAGTTPDGINLVFPQEALSGGLMSRILLVYASKIYKEIPRRKPMDAVLKAWLSNLLKAVNKMEGKFTFTKIADQLMIDLYYYKLKINDSRFDAYASRRANVHLPKLAMCLAASRLSMVIDEYDVQEAHLVLETCELMMTEALGQFGMSKLSRIKQRLLETLKFAKQSITPELLFAMCHQDMTHGEFQESVTDLVNAKKIALVTTRDKSGRTSQAYVFRDTAQIKVDELLEKYADELVKPEPPNLTLIKA